MHLVQYLFVVLQFTFGSCLSFDFGSLSNETQHFVSKRATSICGDTVFAPEVTSLIAGGKALKPGQWPWLAALYRHSSFICGGSIVSENVIVTAAHCILDKGEAELNIPENSYFIVGKHDLDSQYEKDYRTMQVAKFIIHPNWNEKTLSYDADIAVAILVTPIVFTNKIKPICLFPQTESSTDINGKIGVVAGWGFNSEQKLTTNEPRIVDIPMVDNHRCIEKDFQLSSIMSSRNFCTVGNKGKGPCKGDSGGGLCVNQNGKWALRGIVSVTLSGSCTGNSQVVYTDVAQFSKWIQSIIEEITYGSTPQNVPFNRPNQGGDFPSPDQPIVFSQSSKVSHAEYLAESNCGYSNLNSFNVRPGDLSWLSIESFDGELYCVAYLVTSKHVLVAANCVYPVRDAPPRNYNILVGQYSSQPNDGSAVKIGVSKIAVHPNYIPDHNENNLAVVFLKSAASKKTPICLPQPKKNFNGIFGKKLYVIGWVPVFAKGRVSPSGSARITSAEPANLQDCIDAYADDLALSEGQYFCMGPSEGRGPCDVDYDGSGVMIQKKGRWHLRGIKLLSVLTRDKCDPTKPVVFIDIAQYVNWILNVIQS